jgi:hypothetical protein
LSTSSNALRTACGYQDVSGPAPNGRIEAALADELRYFFKRELHSGDAGGVVAAMDFDPSSFGVVGGRLEAHALRVSERGLDSQDLKS